MSRKRTRPTREETRTRLLEAAAELFAQRGIGATTIEHICDQAGFSRGAFYSNFEAKDELVLELLDTHLNSNIEELEQLYRDTGSPVEFLQLMDSNIRERTGPLDIPDGGILSMELVLYALRNPENRPRLIERQRRLAEMNIQFVTRIMETVGKDYPLPINEVAAIVMALDEGFNLHQLIDPESYRTNQFSDALVALHRLWLKD